MHPRFARKLGLGICKTNESGQKINSNRVETCGIIIAFFLINDQNQKSHFFQKTFILAEISMDTDYRILFFILSNIKVKLQNQEFDFRLYTTAEIIFTTKQVDLAEKIELSATAFDLQHNILVVHLSFLTIFDWPHSFCKYK